MDNDGKMTLQEFTIAMHLIQVKLRGVEIPRVLPYSLKSSSIQTKSVFDKGFSDNVMQGQMMPSVMPVSNGAPGGGMMPSTGFGQSTNFSMLSNPSSGFSTGMSGFGSNPQMGHSSAFGTPSFPASNVPSTTSAFSSLGGFNSLSNWGGTSNMQTSITKQQPPSNIGWGQPPSSGFTSSVNTNPNTALNRTGSLNVGSAFPAATQSSSFSSLGISQISTSNGPNVAGGMSSGSQPSAVGVVTPSNRLKYTQMFKAADHEKTGFIQGKAVQEQIVITNEVFFC